jgi:hypothetical protein
MKENEVSRRGVRKKLPFYGLCAEVEGAMRIFNPLEPSGYLLYERVKGKGKVLL